MSAAPPRLDPTEHPWLDDAPSRVVMDALDPRAEGRARFVGGCVRNALLGEPVDDLDIATEHVPQEAARRLEAAGVKVVPTGLEHGTLTAVAQGRAYEVTTLRRDVETFGRRAVVAFGADWAEDAARRDFRFNAIYADRTGALYDPEGGAQDARAGRVIFIGDPARRIAEDHLRILRFYRFNAWYAAGALDPGGHGACVAARARLAELSVERVWKEFKKLLAAPDPSAALTAMQEGHVLAALWPAPLDLALLLGLIKYERGRSRPGQALVRLAALAGRDRDQVLALCDRMKASRAETARLAAMTGPAPARSGAVRPGLDHRARVRALYHLGVQAFGDRMQLAEAAGEGDAEADLAAASAWTRPRFPVTGRDLIAAGFEAGPTLGETLARLEDAWIASGFTLDRAALIAQAGEADA